MITKDQIEKLVDESLSATDIFLVEVKVKAGNKIMVFLDSDTAVCIDDCVRVSRYIESNLDREVEDYELDVSSAGLDHPLRLDRQFQKYLGRDVEVKMADGRKVIGKLLSFDAEIVEVETMKKKVKSKKVEVEGNQSFMRCDVAVKPAIVF